MDHFPIKLTGSRKGVALLSRRPPENAIVFVHGFGGNPSATWVGFERLINELDEQRVAWSHCDLFFYGYRSHNQITPLAEDLLRFIGAVAARNEGLMLQMQFALPSSGANLYGSPFTFSLGRGAEPYRALFLVGHSAGAVIIREAIRLKLREIAAGGKDLSAWIAK